MDIKEYMYEQQEILEAESFVGQGRFDEAITCYTGLINKNQKKIGWCHFKIGELKTNQGKLDEAIIHYRKAVSYEPKEAVYQEFLGRVLGQRKDFDEAIEYYKIALELYTEENPKAVICNLKIGQFQLRQNLLELATKSYQKAIDLERKFNFLTPKRLSHAYQGLADCLKENGQLEKAISFYEKAIGLAPDNPNFYLGVAKLYSQQVLLDRASYSYQQAIKLKSDLPFRTYANLAKVLKQQGKEREAVRVINSCKDIETYPKIWQVLNQTNLETLEKESDSFPLELAPNEVREYFQQTSKYKIINLQSLSDEDRSFLKSNNLSLANLKSIEADDAARQELYLKHFGQNQKLKSWQSSALKIPKAAFQRDYRTDFQQAMIETGYIYTVCPFSGKTVTSNRSIVVSRGNIRFWGAYHFRGDEPFYLLATRLLYNLEAVYFPRVDLIVLLTKIPGETKEQWSDLLNNLKTLMVANWQRVLNYLTYEGKRDLAVAGVAEMTNLAHNLVNDISGIDKLSKAGMLSKVDKFICGNQEYFGKLKDIFPEINQDRIVRSTTVQELPTIVLDNNYFALAVGDKIVSERLAERIYDVSVKKCTPSFLSRVEESQKCFPLVWISFRLHNRAWCHQEEGIANIIEKLAVEFPNLGVVFDGFSISDSHVDLNGRYPSFVKAQIEQEKEVIKQISDILPDGKFAIYDAVGCRLHESIVWAYAVDFFIGTLGANLTKICTLANKPGIGHCCTGYFPSAEPWWNAPRENGVNPTIISAHHITDLEKEKGYKSNYDVDWKIIYDEVIKLIPRLNKR